MTRSATLVKAALLFPRWNARWVCIDERSLDECAPPWFQNYRWYFPTERRWNEQTYRRVLCDANGWRRVGVRHQVMANTAWLCDIKRLLKDVDPSVES